MVRSIYYAMERQEVMKSLPSMLFVDNLTGLYDRDGLNILAEQQINIANCTKKGLFVIYININGMKWINDTIGHKEGEQVLIDAAGIFKETFRSSDIIARIGGDEFVIITIDARRDYAGIVESRLEENARIHGVMNNKRYRLSMSAGITYYDPENPVSFGELLTQAKNMMYEQKSSAGKFQMM